MSEAQALRSPDIHRYLGCIYHEPKAEGADVSVAAWLSAIAALLPVSFRDCSNAPTRARPELLR